MSTEDQERGQRHQTAVQHPLDRLGADVVVPHYCGQRQRHGGLVDQNHRVRESRRRRTRRGCGDEPTSVLMAAHQAILCSQDGVAGFETRKVP